MLIHLRHLLLTVGLLLFAAACAHASTAVVIVSSERSTSYREATEALVTELERGGLSRQDVTQLLASEWEAAGPLTPRLFVAFGAEAVTVLAKAPLRAPLLAALLPRSSFERALLQSGRKGSSQFSALYLDQPLSRQLDLIHLALPNARRIGVLWGPASKGQATALSALLRARGLALVEANIEHNESIFPKLKKILEEADLLLALPDSLVYNSTSIQNILLTSIRARVPVVAFSAAFVRAGALLAVHVTPTQIGQQAAMLAQGVLRGKALPAMPVYASDFSVALNEHVARSLGLNLDADALSAQLHRRETGP
jgi:putative ABC transport system substrate-binding protein